MVCGRVGYPNVNNSAFLQFNNYENIDWVKEPIVENRKVARPDITRMVLDKSSPIVCKGRRVSHQANVFLDGSFAQSNAQFQEFASDSLRTPKRVLLDYSTDDLDGFRCKFPFCLSILRDMTPIQAEQISMPGQERIRLDDVNGLVPES